MVSSLSAPIRITFRSCKKNNDELFDTLVFSAKFAVDTLMVLRQPVQSFVRRGGWVCECA